MTQTAQTAAAKASHIRPVSLIRGTYVTTDLVRARRFFEDVLGMDVVRHRPDALLVRERGHRPGESKANDPYWVLDVREVETIAVPQQMLNHWGVDLSSEAEVDEAYQTLVANAEAFSLKRIQKPRGQHNSYSFYFIDWDSNWWEVEYRTPEFVYSAIRDRGDQV